MADLIAIGYPDETTAEAAADEARQLARDLIIEPDAIAVIVRDAKGDYHVHTHHHMVGRGATWGMFWGLLFGVLFFVPVIGVAVGAGLGALMGKVTKSGIDAQFQEQVRGMLKPGLARGNDRHLRHGEESVPQNQQEDDADLDPQHARPTSSRSRPA